MASIETGLLGLECPMNWNLHEAQASPKIRLDSQPEPEPEPGSERIKRYLKEKLQCDATYAVADDSASWQKCSQYFTLAWTEFPDSLPEMRVWLDRLDSYSNDTDLGIPLLKRYSEALNYITNAMVAHLLYKENKLDEVSNHLGLITPFDEMEEKDRAAIMAMKSCVFMEFGPAGHKEAYEAIQKALELETDQAEWHFLKGKCLSRCRRAHDFKSVPTEEELFHLRKAVALKAQSASHYAFCGQSVKEYGLYSPQAQNDPAIRDAHMDECEEYMTFAACLNDNSAIILTRIAKGLMHTKGDRGADLLEHCVHRSFELFPNSGLVNHVAGNYYMYRKQDNKKAIFHLKKAALEHGVFGAFINLLDIVWKTCTEIELEPLVMHFWKEYRDDPVNRLKAVHVMASYEFFVKNDLVKAISYGKLILPTDAYYENHDSHFVRCRDLIIALIGEAKYRLKTTNTNLSSDDEEVMKTFLNEVLEARPELDLARIIKTRDIIIKEALIRMRPADKRVVSRKLAVNDVPDWRQPSGHRPHPPAGPARTRTTETGRVLPANWRRP